MKYLKKHRDDILIFSFFILLSIVITYPLVFKMKSHMYGQPGDPLGMIWFFWWLKYSGINHISSSFCSLIAAPFGIDYSEPALYTVPIFFTKRFALLTNEIFVYNFRIFFSFLFAAVAMYYLVFYLTKNRIAGTISGIAYAFSPCHFAQVAQHIGLAEIQWMPLYLLALFKLEEKRSYRYALLTALALSLVTFTDYYHLYFMFIMTIAFILWGMWRFLRRRQQITRKVDFHFFRVILVTVLLASAFILPFTHSLIREVFIAPTSTTRATFFHPLQDLFTNSARPLSYLLPSQNNPIFGRYTKGFIGSHFYGWSGTEHTLYLGYAVIVLSIVAVREWRRNREQVGRWESEQARKGETENGRNGETGKGGNRVSKTERRRDGETERRKNRSPITDDRSQKAVSFFLFATIMALIFSHAPYTDIGNFRIFFPSYFMYKILPMVRVYARFGILVILCVSVLAGIGLASILERIKSAKKGRVFISVVLLLIFIEFAPTLPAPMVNAVNPPPVYEWLSREKGDFIVAEYPMENDVEYLFWQRIHQKRLVNGAQPRTDADEVRKEIVDILKPEAPGILSYLGAKYVILHPAKYLKSEDVPVIGEVPDVSKQKGLRLIKTFEEIQVYKIVAEPIKPTVED